jgi:chemotaxis protein methyltransferase CheR
MPCSPRPRSARSARRIPSAPSPPRVRSSATPMPPSPAPRSRPSGARACRARLRLSRASQPMRRRALRCARPPRRRGRQACAVARRRASGSSGAGCVSASASTIRRGRCAGSRPSCWAGQEPGVAGAAPGALRAREGPHGARGHRTCRELRPSSDPRRHRAALRRTLGSGKGRAVVRTGAAVRGRDPLKPEEFRLLRDLFARAPAPLRPRVALRTRATPARAPRVLKLSTFAEYHHYLRFGTAGGRRVGRGDRAPDDERDVLLPRGLPAPRLQERGPAHARLAGRRGAAALRLERGLLDGRGGVHDRDPPQVGFVFRLGAVLRAAGWDVRVYGSDISKRCVAAARRGVYGPRAASARCRTSTSALVLRREAPTAGTSRAHPHAVPLRPDEPARRGESPRSSAGRRHLLPERAHLLRRYSRRKRVIDIFVERLYPGGVLLLGHSESLLNVSTAFELLHLKDDLVYRSPSAPPCATPASPALSRRRPPLRELQPPPAHPAAGRRRLGVQPPEHRRRLRRDTRRSRSWARRLTARRRSSSSRS